MKSKLDKSGKGKVDKDQPWPSPDSPEKTNSEDPSADQDFLIAAIGASAGGLEAATDLLRHITVDTGMAFVLIQHLDPKHHSILTELIAKETSLPVVEVTDGMVMNPDCVYVIPPNTTMSVANRALHLTVRQEATRGVAMTIDSFMRSLAEDRGPNCIGIILSGGGTDGTLGLMEIQAQGGVTFAQDEATARHESMPRSAIASGAVDFVLPPKGIAQELVRIARHPLVKRPDRGLVSELVPQEHAGLHSIFQALRKSMGVDFTYYRDTTIRRRIQRRMVVHKIEKLEDYVSYLIHNAAEVKALYNDLLINVTSFFRNPRVFDALKAQVFPQIMNKRPKDAVVRIWTPGCASGEETYSLAIGLLEYLGDKAASVPIQFFGTDISEASVTKARSGFYPENIQADVSSDRLRRFFMKVEGGYRISKTIRDMCIFAQHNLISDPPFSQMDLISCRNLLIYLEPVLQKKIISLFHYALRPSGFLLLGTSEGVGASAKLFSDEDRAAKVFSKRASAARPLATFSFDRAGASLSSRTASAAPKEQVDNNWSLEAQKEFERRLLTHYSPAAVFLNSDLEIIHTRGNVDRYLKIPSGRASLSVLKMVREGLLFDLKSALNRARKDGVSVRKRGIQIKKSNGKNGEQIGEVNLEVAPIRVGDLKEFHFMIVFADVGTRVLQQHSAPSKGASRGADVGQRRVETLEQELSATKEYLHSVIESQEAINEELQSANEEILSSNEELQSTNEELETAKEELQSTNEELSTLNDELRHRNGEMTQINNDLTNLLGSINVGILMLGNDMRIRRFTAPAQKVFGLIPGDIGRPFTNINPKLDGADLQELIHRVIENLAPVEVHVKDREGTSYSMQILPYRTIDNKIEGVVITLVEPQLRAVTKHIRQDAAFAAHGASPGADGPSDD